MSATPEEDPRPASMLQPVTFNDSTEDEQPAVADGYWACIAFMGHNEYTGYVTEIVRNGQPAYRVEMAEKLWGGDPPEERNTFAMAAEQLAADQKPSMMTIVGLVETVGRLIGEHPDDAARGSTIAVEPSRAESPAPVPDGPAALSTGPLEPSPVAAALDLEPPGRLVRETSLQEGAGEGKSEPRKCRAVKHGGITLYCTEDEGHDARRDATWHKAVHVMQEKHAYPGGRHVIDRTETVEWEPVDNIGEATRHLMTKRRFSDD